MAAMLTLYGRPSSFNVQKVLWALGEVGVPFELVHASAMLGPGQTRLAGANPNPLVNTDEYKALNPNSLVPTLKCPGALNGALFESCTIVRYLARKYDADCKVFGGASAEEEASANMWMDWTNSNMDLFPLPVIAAHSTRLQPEERCPETLIKAIATVAKNVAIPEVQLTRTNYLAGDTFSMGDIPLGCMAARFYIAQEVAKSRGLAVQRVATPGLDAWFERLLTRPAFIQGVYGVLLVGEHSLAYKGHVLLSLSSG
eukprot:TRINITY_DN34421_c0_g1_i1.p1 TRINITY_DN34421_c0_g1~~TRINITY_DN34421_c0_g1_i1.p1  ORF type:complete len:257 (-),score=11.20 TRINITY_DN34421_c0_g1_i1:60-830(-)